MKLAATALTAAAVITVIRFGFKYGVLGPINYP